MSDWGIVNDELDDSTSHAHEWKLAYTTREQFRPVFDVHLCQRDGCSQTKEIARAAVDPR